MKPKKISKKSGINYQPQLVNAGFQASTVVPATTFSHEGLLYPGGTHPTSYQRCPATPDLSTKSCSCCIRTSMACDYLRLGSIPPGCNPQHQDFESFLVGNPTYNKLYLLLESWVGYTYPCYPLSPSCYLR